MSLPMSALANALPGMLPALRGNLVVGLTLAVVTLPQAIAFSTTLAGLPPYFGIYAAIWGVLFTALLNPSRVFSGGPNTTMSAAIGLTLLPIAPPFGSDYMGYALTLILLAGLIQLLFVLIRPLGRMLDLINEPIINGLICGIGFFLIFKSLTGFAGLPMNTEVEWPLWIAWQSLLAVLEIGNMYAIQIGLITMITSLVARQIRRLRNWAILIGVIAGTAYSQHLNATVGLQNTLIEQIANLSSIGFVLPSLPVFSQEAMSDIITILPGAVTLALLGLFQTVAAMRRMNRKIGAHTDSRKGILADAVSNCMLPFLSSLPTCASFNRMWLVHSLGANSRWTSVSSAVILLLTVLFFAPLIAIIPMPAMAAVIMLLGANMISWEDIKPHLQNRRETIVFLASFLSVLFLDLFGAGRHPLAGVDEGEAPGLVRRPAQRRGPPLPAGPAHGRRQEAPRRPASQQQARPAQAIAVLGRRQIARGVRASARQGAPHAARSADRPALAALPDHTAIRSRTPVICRSTRCA
jgi:sulfate permease, SulP family